MTPRLRPAFYIPVQGTHGWDDNPNSFAWWENNSAFSQYLKTLGLIHINDEFPFEWSTQLDGILSMDQTKHIVWKAAGKALSYYVGRQFPKGLPYDKRNLIAHSHGGQVVFYACADGLEIRNLITVGTPVRGDMEAVVFKARKNIKNWLHICDSKNDLVAIAGTLFDGRLRIQHTFNLADRNDNCSDQKISHSLILNDPSKFGLWETQDWARHLTL